MSRPTLLNGARTRIERPRALSATEARHAIMDRVYEDTDWEDGDDGEYQPFSTAPCAWVAMIEAAALAGAL